MQESDTYLMILEEGEEKATRNHILLVGEARLGAAPDQVRSYLSAVADRDRLERLLRCAANATSWQEIVQTP